MRGEINRFFIIKKNKEVSTLLCSVVKHLGTGIEHLRGRDEYSTLSRVSPYTSIAFYRFLPALQQNRAQSRILHFFLNIECNQGKKNSILFLVASCSCFEFQEFCRMLNCDIFLPPHPTVISFVSMLGWNDP